MWREEDGTYWCCNPKSEAKDLAGGAPERGPTGPLQCLRCGTIDAFGPVSHKRLSPTAQLVQVIEAEARRYAAMYPQASDGRNTFVLFADWVASLALTSPDGGSK